eukprot:6334679-Prymnesium_polylepis.1
MPRMRYELAPWERQLLEPPLRAPPKVRKPPPIPPGGLMPPGPDVWGLLATAEVVQHYPYSRYKKDPASWPVELALHGRTQTPSAAAGVRCDRMAACGTA